MSDDVLSTRRLSPFEFRDVLFGARPIDVLALWFFLSRHTTASLARIAVIEVYR